MLPGENVEADRSQTSLPGLHNELAETFDSTFIALLLWHLRPPYATLLFCAESWATGACRLAGPGDQGVQVPARKRARDAGNLLRQDDLSGPLLGDQRYLEPDQLMFATRAYTLSLQQAPSETL